MAAIHGVLKEELERLKSLSKKYIDEINKLPKGCISLKERKGHLYAYLAYREKGKVLFKYIGKASLEKVKTLKQKVENRQKYELLLKKIKRDMKEIERAVYGRKK